MATILNAYALSGGETLSTAVSNANNVRFQFEVSGATDTTQRVMATLMVDDGTAYVPLVERVLNVNRTVEFPILGNAKFSRNISEINSASVKVKIEPVGTCSGNLTITAVSIPEVQSSQTVDASGNILYPSGTPISVSREITRPADTTAYTAGDTINADAANSVLEFDGMSITDTGGGILMEAKVETNITTFASQTIRLWVYNAAPATPLGDNAAFVNAYADKNKLLYFVDVDMEALNAGSDSVVGIASVAKEYVTATGSLFVVPQSISAVTPTSGGKVNISLSALKLS